MFYLASGPLSINVIEGSIEVLGFPVKAGSTIVIPLGRSVSIKVLGSINVSDRLKLKPLDVKVYETFDSIAESISAYERIILIGPTDSGKSTLASWISNKKALKGVTTYYLTTDVGQNEVFCPGFTALARTTPPVIPGYSGSFTDIKPCFVGSFTPSDSIDKYIDCASKLAKLAKGSLIVDTDGWVTEEGIRSKVRLANEIEADVIVAVGLEEGSIEQFRSTTRAEIIKLPRLVEKEKTVEERRVHRERLLTLRLLGARQVKVRVDEVEVEGIPLFKGKPLDYSTLKSISQRLVYAEQVGSRMVAVYKGAVPPGVEGILLPLEWERNLIAAVYCNDHIKPGIIERIDYKTKSIIVRTPCNEKIRRIEVGKVKVEGLT